MIDVNPSPGAARRTSPKGRGHRIVCPGVSKACFWDLPEIPVFPDTSMRGDLQSSRCIRRRRARQAGLIFP